MLRTGEDEKLRARYRSLRTDEERDAPSFERLVASAPARPVARGWLVQGLALAGLTLAACVAVIALVGSPSRPAPGASEATNRSVAPAAEAPNEPAVETADDAVAPTPASDSSAKKSAPKPRAPRRARTTQPACETC